MLMFALKSNFIAFQNNSVCAKILNAIKKYINGSFEACEITIFFGAVVYSQ